MKRILGQTKASATHKNGVDLEAGTVTFKDPEGNPITKPLSPELIEKMKANPTQTYDLEGNPIPDYPGHPSGEDGFSVRLKSSGSESGALHIDFWKGSGNIRLHWDAYGGGFNNWSTMIQHMFFEGLPYEAGVQPIVYPILGGGYRTSYVGERRY